MQIGGQVLRQRVSQLRYALKILSDGQGHPRERLFPDAKKQHWPTVVLHDLESLGLIEFVGPPTRHRKYISAVDTKELSGVDLDQVLLMPSPSRSRANGVSKGILENAIDSGGIEGDVTTNTGYDEPIDTGPDVGELLARRLQDLTTAILTCGDKISVIESELRKPVSAVLKPEVLSGVKDTLHNISARLTSITQVEQGRRLTFERLIEAVDELPEKQRELYAFLVEDLQNAFDGLHATFSGVRAEQVKLETIVTAQAEQLLKMDARLDAREVASVKRDEALIQRDKDMVKTIADALVDLQKSVGVSIHSCEKATEIVAKEFIASNRKMVDSMFKNYDATRQDLVDLVKILMNEESTSREIIKRAFEDPSYLGKRGNLVRASIPSAILAMTQDKKK